MEKHELSKAEWLDKCEAYCARAEHCAADVRRKLYEWGAPADFADEQRIVYGNRSGRRKTDALSYGNPG